VRPWAFTEIFKQTPDSDDGKTMRSPSYKLLRFDDGHEEFYHLASDPGESDNLLTGSLNADELLNYQYLCGEMSTLVSGIAFCNTSVGTNEVAAPSVYVYPNPFKSRIYLQIPEEAAPVVLMNPIGQLIFSGQHIEQQDFTNLTPGTYFLRVMGRFPAVLKLEKK
jgi:hypothetical protein